MLAVSLSRIGSPAALRLEAMPSAQQLPGSATELAGNHIVFHGRLDDSAALAAMLGASAGHEAESGDALLVLRAYRRFRTACLGHLTGDFAFMLWDAQERRLLCARDRFGVGSLFFHDRPDRFLCAADPLALLASGEVDRATDEAVLVGILAGRTPPAGRTVHTAIAELPAAHFLLVTAEGVRLERYWQLPLPDTVVRADGPEQLLALLDAAVARRLHTPRRLGTLVSGGLDSSSITALAARRAEAADVAPPSSFTLVYDDYPEHNERRWAEAVLRDRRIRAHFVDAGDVSPFADMPALLTAAGGPFLGPNFATTRRLHRYAAAQGVDVLLDGHGGDEVISTGAGLLGELAEAGRWHRLVPELRALARAEGQPAWPLLLTYMRRFLLPAGVRRVINAAERRLRPPRTPASAAMGFLAPAAIETLAGTAERKQAPRRSYEDRLGHHEVLAADLQPYALGLLTRVGAANGVELRYPFWDAALIDFCVSLPAADKLAGGWTRMALRRATAGLLPDEVRWRRKKFDFTPHLVRNMIGADAVLIDQALHDDRGGVGRFAALAAVRAAWRRMQAGTADGYDVQAVWRTVMTALWLDGGAARASAALAPRRAALVSGT